MTSVLGSGGWEQERIGRSKADKPRAIDFFDAKRFFKREAAARS